MTIGHLTSFPVFKLCFSLPSLDILYYIDHLLFLFFMCNSHADPQIDNETTEIVIIEIERMFKNAKLKKNINSKEDKTV